MLISTEGCIGAGKSTVATGLAAYRGSKLLLENFEANPFLDSFYDDPGANVIETEFAFLLLHFHQLKSQARQISTSEVISDFTLDKDLWYAALNINDSRTKQVFSDLYSLCRDRTARPALMIFLSAPTDLIMERIRLRGRISELAVDATYFHSLNDAYEEAFQHYDGKKIQIPMEKWNFVTTPDLFRTLSSLVDRALSNEYEETKVSLQ
jgi:deoxyadenosine/deoxycytidine kinase